MTTYFKKIPLHLAAKFLEFAVPQSCPVPSPPPTLKESNFPMSVACRSKYISSAVKNREELTANQRIRTDAMEQEGKNIGWVAEFCLDINHPTSRVLWCISVCKTRAENTRSNDGYLPVVGIRSLLPLLATTLAYGFIVWRRFSANEAYFVVFVYKLGKGEDGLPAFFPRTYSTVTSSAPPITRLICAYPGSFHWVSYFTIAQWGGGGGGSARWAAQFWLKISS